MRGQEVGETRGNKGRGSRGSEWKLGEIMGGCRGSEGKLGEG